MFPGEVSKEAHDVPGKILVSKENVDGKMGLPLFQERLYLKIGIGPLLNSLTG